MRKTIAITGANSFIAEALMLQLLKKKFNIKAFTRNVPLQPRLNVQYYKYEMDKPVNAANFNDVHILIHLAHSFSNKNIQGYNINVYAAKQLKKLNIPIVLYISSFAALEPVTQSSYGLTKDAVQNVFAKNILIQPGLVIGNGGLYKKMYLEVLKHKFLPIIKNGDQKIQTIALQDLVATILKVIELPKSNAYAVAHHKPISYKKIIEAIARKQNRTIYFIPVPIFFLKVVLFLLQLIGRQIITKDNIIGLLTNKEINTLPIQALLEQNWMETEKAIALTSLE